MIQLNILVVDSIQRNNFAERQFFVSSSTMIVRFEIFEHTSFVEALLTTEHQE